MTAEPSLVLARVVTDPGEALATALDRELTGYAKLVPQDALLLDEAGHGLLALENGVPTRVYHAGTGRGGPEALADLAQPGPYKVELYGTDAPPVPDGETVRVPPDMPAERLAGDAGLADRTREAAPGDDPADTDDGLDAVEAFLADEEKIAAIQEQARAEAERHAEEWGFEDLARPES